MCVVWLTLDRESGQRLKRGNHLGRAQRAARRRQSPPTPGRPPLPLTKQLGGQGGAPWERSWLTPWLGALFPASPVLCLLQPPSRGTNHGTQLGAGCWVRGRPSCEGPWELRGGWQGQGQGLNGRPGGSHRLARPQRSHGLRGGRLQPSGVTHPPPHPGARQRPTTSTQDPPANPEQPDSARGAGPPAPCLRPPQGQVGEGG